jgi:hypothetical protein
MSAPCVCLPNIRAARHEVLGIGRIGPHFTSGKGRYAKFLLAARLRHPPMLAFPGRSGAVQTFASSE